MARPAPELSEQYRLLLCLEQLAWTVGYVTALGRPADVEHIADTVTELLLHLGLTYLDCDPQGGTDG